MSFPNSVVSGLLALLCLAGCAQQTPAPQESATPTENLTRPQTEAPTPEKAPPVVAEAPPNDQAESSSPLAAPSKALSSLAQSISQAYEAAKSKGQTAATSARDWLIDDLSSGHRWEYKILPLDGDDPADWEQQLNDLGRDGWQCFHVQSTGDSTHLFFQRHPTSISRSIPMSDLLKVLPYLGLGQDGG